MPLERMAHVRPTAVAVVALFSLVLVLAGCGANAPIQSASVGSRRQRGFTLSRDDNAVSRGGFASC
jgi:hypothetical protein